jgi:hypothetical protein
MKQWWKKLSPAQKIALAKSGVSMLTVVGWTIYVVVKDQPIGEDRVDDFAMPVYPDPIQAIRDVPQRAGFAV